MQGFAGAGRSGWWTIGERAGESALHRNSGENFQTPTPRTDLNSALIDVFGILGCLCGSAFFSGSETALTALSEPQMQRLIEDEGATSVALWRDKPIEVLTMILIGNNVFNITASALATDLADRLLAGGAIPAAVGVMTFLLLTFGEITPKTVAKQYSVKVAGPIMFMMNVPWVILWPFTQVFTKMTRGMLTAMGSDPAPSNYVTAEEIEYMIDIGSREGTFSEDRERLLRSVFEFPDTVVREVMIPRTEMVAISADMDLETVVDTLLDCGHSRIPVYDDSVDQIVGLFYAKDLIRLVPEDYEREFDVHDHLRRPYFVPESKGIAELLSEFQAERLHMAIVVDEFGGTAGVITLEDIIEEFFGDIQDEYDTEPAQIFRLDSETARADARVPIDEVESFLESELPEHPDYETLGGFLMARSGTVPEPGQTIGWKHLKFHVVDANAKRVKTVDIEVTDPEEFEGEEPELEGLPETALDEEIESEGAETSASEMKTDTAEQIVDKLQPDESRPEGADGGDEPDDEASDPAEEEDEAGSESGTSEEEESDEDGDVRKSAS